MPVLQDPTSNSLSQSICGTLEERLEVVERVALSSAFRKSVRLRDFLRYVGQQAAATDAAEIHEQEIGQRVFGRRRDYDRSQDNIVRVNATELRRRVEAYFATEGADDPIVFSIPRGSYMPVFRLNHSPQPATVLDSDSATEQGSSTLDPSVVVAVPQIRPPSQKFWTAAAIVALSVFCAALLWQNAHLRKESSPLEKHPTVDALWANMIGGQRDTDLVLPDDSISVEEEMTGKRIPLRDYTDRNFLHDVDLSKLSRDRVSDLELVLSHNLVTLGGFYAALRIHDLQPRSTTLHLAWARFYSADSMKKDNVVFIGGAKANPWVGLYEDQLNFQFDYNNPTHSLFIHNRHPQPGESATYAANASSAELAGYAVAAYLPNPTNKGNVMLLLGSDSDASNAASEFLTSEESLSRLLQTMHTKTFPHFELLLQVSRVRGTSLAAKVMAYRIYP